MTIPDDSRVIEEKYQRYTDLKIQKTCKMKVIILPHCPIGTLGTIPYSYDKRCTKKRVWSSETIFRDTYGLAQSDCFFSGLHLGG